MYKKQILWFIVILLAMLSLMDLGVSFYKPETKPTNAQIKKEIKLVDTLFKRAIPKKEYDDLYRKVLSGLSTEDLNRMLKDKKAINKNKRILLDIEKQALELKYRKLRMLISPGMPKPKLPPFISTPVLPSPTSRKEMEEGRVYAGGSASFNESIGLYEKFTS